MKKIPFSAERVCVCSRRVQTRAVSLRTEIRFFRLRSQFTVWVRAGGGDGRGSTASAGSSDRAPSSQRKLGRNDESRTDH